MGVCVLLSSLFLRLLPGVCHARMRRFRTQVEEAFNKLDHDHSGTIRTEDIGRFIGALELPEDILELLLRLRVPEFLVSVA